MRYLFIFGILLFVLSGCDTAQNTPPPTFTPLAINPVATEPIAINTDIPSTSCMTIDEDIQAQRANIPRTLPNGKAFPGKAPRTIEDKNKGKGHKTKDGRIEVMVQFTSDSRPNERNEYIRNIGGTSRRQIDA